MLYFGGTLGAVTDWPDQRIYGGNPRGLLWGACVILGLIIYFSAKVKNNVMLLIIGIMIGYLASSVISILNYYSSTDRVHAFVMWGLGNFFRCILGTITILWNLCVNRAVISDLADQAFECLIIGRNVCR